MAMTKTPLIKQIISYVEQVFLEDSDYKADLHKDLVALCTEIKNMNGTLVEVLREYKNAITLVRMRKPRIKLEEE